MKEGKKRRAAVAALNGEKEIREDEKEEEIIKEEKAGYDFFSPAFGSSFFCHIYVLLLLHSRKAR